MTQSRSKIEKLNENSEIEKLISVVRKDKGAFLKPEENLKTRIFSFLKEVQYDSQENVRTIKDLRNYLEKYGKIKDGHVWLPNRNFGSKSFYKIGEIYKKSGLTPPKVKD